MLTTFLQNLVFGLQLGSEYALIALGYTMVYGVLRLINFAHGDVWMVGGYIAIFFIRAMMLHHGWGPSWSLFTATILLCMLGCGALGFIIERLAYRPLRKAPRLAALITAIGVSLLIENVGQLQQVFGTEPQTCPAVLPGGDPKYTGLTIGPTLLGMHMHRMHVDFHGVIVLRSHIIFLGASLILLGILWYVVSYTKLGRAMRAVAFDQDAASLMGVNSNSIVSFTFFIGSALAGAAGFMTAALIQLPFKPISGIIPGLKAFTAAVIGGIGNIPGAAVGGFLMGIIEAMVAHSTGGLKDAVAFAVLILVLLVRPTGLFGKGVVEKV